MEYRKNDIVTLKIEDCGMTVKGIGKADGFTVFVKDAVIGDTVRAKIMKAKKNYGYGRLERSLHPHQTVWSQNVLFARQCGGCQLQALSYEKQLEFKAGKVKDTWNGSAALRIFPWKRSLEWSSLSTIEIKPSFLWENQRTAELLPDFMQEGLTALLRTGTALLEFPRIKRCWTV